MLISSCKQQHFINLFNNQKFEARYFKQNLNQVKVEEKNMKQVLSAQDVHFFVYQYLCIATCEFCNAWLSSDNVVIRASALQSVDLSLFPCRGIPKDIKNWYSRLSCLTFSIKRTVWRLNLGVADIGGSDSKTVWLFCCCVAKATWRINQWNWIWCFRLMMTGYVCVRLAIGLRIACS